MLAGFGIGDLPEFMLDRQEAARLCRATVTHDPHCGLFLVGSEGWSGPVERSIETAIGDLVSARFGRTR